MFIPIPQPSAAARAKAAADKAENGDAPDDSAPITEATVADAAAQGPIARAVLAAMIAVLTIAMLLLALARSVGAQGTRAGQATPIQSAFVVIKGADTIAVERVMRTRTAIQGELVIRNQPRVSYGAEIEPGTTVPLIAFQAYGPGTSADAPALQTGSVRIVADSAIIEVTAGGASQRVPVAISGSPLPLINLSFGLTELMIARARGAAAPFAGKFISLSAGALTAKVEFVGADSAILTTGNIVQRFSIDSDGRVTGGRIPSQGIDIVRVTGAAAASIALGRHDYGAPAGAPYSAEEVTVRTRAGHTLSGTLTIPKGVAGRVPAVVTITGSGQEDRDEFIAVIPNYRPFRQLADTLGRRGIAVLRLDDRGINGSGGDLEKATSADFADDIRAGVAYLRNRSEIDGARIALFGHSEGGLIGPMVAATDPALAAVVIFAGPAYTGRKILDFQLKNLVMGNTAIPAEKKDSAAKATLAQFDSTAGKGAWMKFFLDYDPLPALRKVKSPVLILQGGTDQQVTPEQAPIIESTLRAAGNKDVTMRVFPNRNHLFVPDTSGFPGDYAKLRDGRIGADVMGPLADWLVLKLASKPKP